MELNVFFLTGLMLACPMLAALLNACMPQTYAAQGARLSASLTGVSLLITLLCLYLAVSGHAAIEATSFLAARPLNLLLCALVFLVSFAVQRFSWRYMNGDRYYQRYFRNLAALTLSAALLILSDNAFLLWAAWSLTSFFLIRLMVHNPDWPAARQSGLLTLKMLLPASISLLLAMLLVAQETGNASLQSLQSLKNSSPLTVAACALVLLTAFIQSAAWPFSRWLTASLNSPTPVSAMMHAGVINAGGILIVKLAPLVILNPPLLTVLFLMGALSAFIGTFWKLLQTDIKRMLACSTMGQMGFMLMQCGLGLFIPAIIHLCWHGLFKAYLFLWSGGSGVQKKSTERLAERRSLTLMLALIGGVLGALLFIQSSGITMPALNSTLFLVLFTAMAGAQCMLALMPGNLTPARFLLALSITLVTSSLYGKTLFLMEALLPEPYLSAPQPLSLIHVSVLMLFTASWVFFNTPLFNRFIRGQTGATLCVAALNASQPPLKTVTTQRASYPFSATNSTL
ncbi:NADH-ubiquinone oxidoreductase chain 5 [Legionella geestiana]|uniref:NADH-ubiquinone oxidoreductase chain 5 n=1 Tax=Legionella geestiana TaxID=45065 RepID=A0A0W0TXF8_9GAMM|nr:proton-conducting transporter membrane subunit [Legionella geestiana]KTD00157.1 NADH-ubiquinone oxidoreductase chain 5 [Legionella geestiana]QBS11799.1 oxidoreductase [Legionella geestiana]QDQ40587.1 oxidoreductase [Legionella geestiana]STX53508.1 NADH-ubiquinone oxidoreductase chain 5 [Legionella geestiana]